MVQILDTTLREGEQTPYVNFTVDEKVHIAQMLDRIGGTAAQNPEVRFRHLHPADSRRDGDDTHTASPHRAAFWFGPGVTPGSRHQPPTIKNADQIYGMLHWLLRNISS